MDRMDLLTSAQDLLPAHYAALCERQFLSAKFFFSGSWGTGALDDMEWNWRNGEEPETGVSASLRAAVQGIVMGNAEVWAVVADNVGGSACLTMLRDGTVSLQVWEDVRTTRHEGSLQKNILDGPGEAARTFNVDEKEIHAVLAMLAKAGVARASARFSGSGDNGQLDEVEVADAEGRRAPKWNTRKIARAHPDGQRLYAFFDQMTEATGIDWWNNIGGDGEIVLDVTEPALSMKVMQYGEESVLKYEAETHLPRWQGPTDEPSVGP